MTLCSDVNIELLKYSIEVNIVQLAAKLTSKFSIEDDTFHFYSDDNIELLMFSIEVSIEVDT